MNKIKSYDGRVCYLSEETYEILTDDHTSSDYKKGAIVRLISGVDNSKVPGYHFDEHYFTVCKIGAVQAQFCGIRKENLKQVLTKASKTVNFKP
jgi:hypothetical protein